MTLNRRKIKKRKPANMIVTEQVLAAALKASAGIQTKAAQMLGISQSAVSQRVSGSEYLKNIYQEIREEMLDLAESELLKKLREGHLTAIIFYLKCIGKSRGYTEKAELDVNQRHTGGVLVVPGVASSSEEWVAEGRRLEKLKEEQNNASKIH